MKLGHLRSFRWHAREAGCRKTIWSPASCIGLPRGWYFGAFAMSCRAARAVTRSTCWRHAWDWYAVYAVLSFTCGSLRETVHGSESGDCRITSTGGGGDKAGSQSVEGYLCRSLTSYPRSGFHKP